MNWLFLDFETFGKDASDCAVVNLSCMVIDTERFINKPYGLNDISQVKTFKLSAKDQVSQYGYKVYNDTLDFWESQPDDVKSQIKPKKSDLTVEAFCSEFIQYLQENPKIDYWWSRSNTFDPTILYRLFKSTNKSNHLNEYLKFWKVRDVRTYIDGKLDFPDKNGFVPIDDEELWKKTFKEHDSSWDVLADILRIQMIAQYEQGE